MSPTAPQSLLSAPGGREPIPSPTGGAPPGAPPEGPPFHSALETEWARTAIAEGQQQSRSQSTSPADGEQASTTDACDRLPHGSEPPVHRQSGHRAGRPPAGAKATLGRTPAAPTSAAAGAVPALATALPVGANSGELTVGTIGGLALRAPSVRGSATAVAHEDGALSSRTSLADDALATPQHGTSKAVEGADALAGTLEGATADAAAQPRESDPTTGALTMPGDSASIAGGGAQTHSTPAADLAIAHRSSALSTDTGAGALPSSLNSSTSSAGNMSTGADGSPTHADTNRAAAPLRGRNASDAGGHDKLLAPDPAQASTDGATADGLGSLGESTASPLLPSTLDGNPAVFSGELGSNTYGAGLQEAIESLHGTIQLAARQGLTQARISLQPEELGEIRINLTQTAQGLLARVTAEAPAAAQALAAAHAQLRQSLSSLGINLTRLDIGHHDPSSQSAGADPKGRGQGSAAHGESPSAGRPGRSTAIADSGDPEIDSSQAEAPAPSTTPPAHGTLIDVLA